MANVDVTVTNEGYLRDVYSSQTITGGSNIYLRITRISFPFKNILSHKPKIIIDPDFTSDDTGSTVGSNWERRKSPIGYQGFDNLVITLDGFIDLDNSGSLSTTYQLATVGRLWKLWNSPVHMPYYFWDSKLGSGLISNSYDPTIGNPFLAGSIPVIIEDVVFDWSKSSLNKVTYSMVLREDKR